MGRKEHFPTVETEDNGEEIFDGVQRGNSEKYEEDRRKFLNNGGGEGTADSTEANVAVQKGTKTGGSEGINKVLNTEKMNLASEKI